MINIRNISKDLIERSVEERETVSTLFEKGQHIDRGCGDGGFTEKSVRKFRSKSRSTHFHGRIQSGSE